MEGGNAMTLDEQAKIEDWLRNRLNLPIYADAYVGAVMVLYQKPKGYVTFVAHAARDIMNGLARDARGDKREQVQYIDRLDNLNKVWDDRWGESQGFSEGQTLDVFPIPRDVCRQIRSLLRNHSGGRIRSSETDELFFQTFLDYNDKDKIPKGLLREWNQAKQWFLGKAHLRAGAFDDSIADDLQGKFFHLHRSLLIAADSAYNRLKELDEILEETNA